MNYLNLPGEISPAMSRRDQQILSALVNDKGWPNEDNPKAVGTYTQGEGNYEVAKKPKK